MERVRLVSGASLIRMRRWEMHGMYGTSDAKFEVQRTIKRAELTAFLCFFRKVVGPTTVHVDNKRYY